MNARKLYAEMERQTGHYNDGGIICDNGKNITSIVCEIDWYTLYTMMDDTHTLYVVHHPVSDYALAFCDTNKDEDADDIRGEAQNWLLEFRARELGMNLAVAHTMADKMLEAELSDAIAGIRGYALVPAIDAYFNRFFNPHPALVVSTKAKPLLARRASAKVMLGTYGYGKTRKPGMVFIDECSMEETPYSISIPHSLVDAAAMKLWKQRALKICGRKV
ncbi:MAG: hypothetical protein HZC28_02900 [Spirochaetes bacterium]|nr:hypothetical protein [Spirochaetota bacterium]